MLGWSGERRKPAGQCLDACAAGLQRRLTLDSARAQALDGAKYMYVTTYSQGGKSGTVPTWLWTHDGAIFFTTQRHTLKARRIRDNGRVTVHVGTREGPAFEGRAEWVEDRPDLEQALLHAY